MKINEQITLYHGDCLEIMKDLPDKSVDLVIADPPYGMNIDTWDKAIPKDQIKEIINEIQRIGKEYLALFGQIPYNRTWDKVCENQGILLKEHVVWVKRIVTPSRRLSRGHESIYIYSINGNTKFYRIKGLYQDVKVPGILFDTISLEGIKRYIANLRLEVKTGQKDRGQIIGNHKGSKAFQRYRFRGARSPENCNYTNVWSFLPENRNNQNKGIQFHPTSKPIKLLQRLVELLTPTKGIVLDPFIGSGTTGVACIKTNRQFIGIELDKKYFEMAKNRIESELAQTEFLRTA